MISQGGDRPTRRQLNKRSWNQAALFTAKRNREDQKAIGPMGQRGAATVPLTAGRTSVCLIVTS